MSLSPEHLADLRASGLTDDTIEACQFKAVPPNKLRILRGIESAYEIPYFYANGTLKGFSRWKLFYRPDFTGDRRRKYHQAKGSDAQFFFPPQIDWKAVISDPTRVIVFVEGEKKAIALAQVGIAAIGVSGVWNWRQKLDNGERLVLLSLDQIVLSGRPVLLLPDSDCWRPEKLQALEGFYALGMEIRSRSASPSFVVLQDAGRKVGADDWLVASGGDWEHRWPMLERISLDDPQLAHVAKWWQSWRERQATEESLRQSAQERLNITDLGGAYQVQFPIHSVTFHFGRITENARGVNAQLTVTFGQLEVLGLTDLSLRSDPSRGKIAGSLSKLVSSTPWKRLLERACAEVVRRHQRGEPIVELRPADSTHVPYVIDPLAYKNHQTLIFAPGGSFKSYLVLYFALVATAGARQNRIAAKPIKVLYLDYELDEETVGARLKALHTGHPELTHVRPYYRCCTQPLHLEAPSLAAEVAKLGVGLVIVDSAALACGGDLNSPESAIRLQQALRRLNCASIVLAHVAKSTAEGQERSTYGTVFFRELARNVWELYRHENSTRVLLSQTGGATKNSFGAKHDPLGFEVGFAADSVRITAFDPTDEDAQEFDEKLPAKERIKRHLSDGKLRSPKDISDEVGISVATVRSELSRGKKAGQFIRVGSYQDGKWTVRTPQTQPKQSLQPIVATKIDDSSLQSLQPPTKAAKAIDKTVEAIIAPLTVDRCTPSMQCNPLPLGRGAATIATTMKTPTLTTPHSNPLVEEVIDL